MANLVGQQLGDYRILELIGKGGMGHVYLAEHVDLRKKYAMKVLPAELARDRDVVERFHDEARVMAELGKHPYIVEVHNSGHVQLPDTDPSEDVYFLAMDYVVGPAGAPLSLHDHLKTQPDSRLPEAQVRKWVIQIAEALAYAHEQGVVHRDIKPANILIDAKGNVKLTDYGLAKAVGQEFINSQVHESLKSLGSLRTLRAGAADGSMDTLDAAATRSPDDSRRSSASSILGTYDYMAPEQREGGEIDERTDIYAFGVLLYRILTGRIPGRFTKPPSRVAAVSAAWDAVVERCMGESPQDRYCSAMVLLEALRSLSLHSSAVTQAEPAPKVQAAEVPVEPSVTSQLSKPLAGPESLAQDGPSSAQVPTLGLADPSATPPRGRRSSVGEELEVDREAPSPIASPLSTKGERTRRIVVGGMAAVFAGLLIYAGLREIKSEGGSPRINSMESESAARGVPTQSAKRPQTLPLFCDDARQVPLDLVLIPPGSFTMGSNDGTSDEKPPHQVTISQPFCMGKYEVTNRQYRCFKPEHNSGDYQGQDLNGDQQPVVKVSWNEAKAFCDWLTKRNSRQVRLPSEAEWEYVARGGKGWEFPWGNSWPPRGQAGNYADLTAKEKFKDFSIIDGYRDGCAVTSPVGKFDANPLELFDLGGNAWEWCEDVYHENYAGAPTNGSAWSRGGDQNSRVLRGGSWSNNGRSGLRSANRDWLDADGLWLVNGFRVVVWSSSAGTP